MKKKKITFDEIPSTLVEIMDRLAAIEKLLKDPKAPKMPKMPPVPEAVSVKEKVAAQPGTISAEMASKLIGKAKITLYNLAKKGKVPARKLGRNWVFVEAELLEWLRKRKPGRKPRVSRKPIDDKPVDQPVKRRGRKPGVSRKPIDDKPVDQPAKRRGRKPKMVKVVEKPVKVVVEKKKRGRPKKNSLVIAPPLTLRTGRRPRIIKK